MKKTRLDIYDGYGNSQIDAAINEWIHSERDRQVLHLKLVDGLSFECIAEIMDMSPKGIQKIVYKAQDKLHRHLEIMYK